MRCARDEVVEQRRYGSLTDGGGHTMQTEQMLIVVLPGAIPLLRVEKGNASEFYLMQFAKCKTLVRVNHDKSSNKFEPG